MARRSGPIEVYAASLVLDESEPTDKDPDVLECVINVSEGRHADVLASLAAAAGDVLLDVHRDGDHHRSVFTLAGPDVDVEAAAARLAAAAAAIDLREHRGVHPRLGSIDVVPWVALDTGSDGNVRNGPMDRAVAARDRFARWAAAELALPCFLYGPVSPDPALAWTPPEDRRLPDLRRRAWHDLAPDTGPDHAHPSLGAACVGARGVLVAYNLWLARADLATARHVAAAIRGPGLRTLGLAVGGAVQVSCNLIDPWTVGPAAAYDAVASRADVARAELVGLLPRSVLVAVPSRRWRQLDLNSGRTIEARLEQAGLDGGRLG